VNITHLAITARLANSALCILACAFASATFLTNERFQIRTSLRSYTTALHDGAFLQFPAGIPTKACLITVQWSENGVSLAEAFVSPVSFFS
jgi:hypothetical protein